MQWFQQGLLHIARHRAERRHIEDLETLLASLRELRAKTIVREGHPATVPVDGVEKPWAYLLEATLEPPGDGPLVLTLAERAGGMTQLAGNARLDLVFTLEQPFLDALWSLLHPESKPSESKP